MGEAVALDRARTRESAHHVPVLLAAIAAAVVAQGGYYLPGRALATSLVVVALLLAPRVRFGLLPAAAAAIAAWAVLRAVLNGTFTNSLPVVATAGSLAAAALVAQRADAGRRELCASVVVGVGVLVALTGWAAVVWRIPSWSVVADDLVRAASTLTYPNAAAALLAALVVLAIALHITHPRSSPRAGAVYALLVGVGATLSRAGLLALLVGLVALAAFAGVRPTLRHAGPAGLGALVALAALAPSFPVRQPAPGLAVLGLVVGLAVTLGLSRAGAVARSVVVVVGFAAAAPATFLVYRRDLARMLEGRISTSSPDRSGATQAALDRVAAQPWAGMGPGNGWFVFTGPEGDVRVMRYVHDEYLQVLVELGAIGLGLLVLVLLALAVTVRRGRTAAPLWAGAAAALVVLLVHSGFDFLWHLPVIVLAAGLLTGLAASPIDGESSVPAAETPVEAAEVPTTKEKQ